MGGFSTGSDTSFSQSSVGRWEEECLPAHLEVGRNWFFNCSKKINQVLASQETLSFLPEGFSLEVDSDAIRNITLPRGHKIIYHTHDQDKNLTIFLAYATNSMCQEKQFYFIFTCKLHNYFTAAGMFLSRVTTELTASSNPVMFPFSVSFPVEEVAMVQPLFLQKLPPMLLFMLLKQMLVNYGNFGFEAVSTYEDVTRWVYITYIALSCMLEQQWLLLFFFL